MGIIFLCLFHMVMSFSLCAQIGYICVPIADLLADPCTATTSDGVKNFYRNIPISPERTKESCARARQVIFNEQVTILEYKNYQYYIELHNCFYKPSLNQNIEPVRLWTYEDALVCQDELQHYAIPASVFPKPYSYAVMNRNDCCISLIEPWYDDNTKTTYSIGTRFVMTQATDTDYRIEYYNHETKSVFKAKIPKYKALSVILEDESRKQFVSLLYKWCSYESIIPFVWGGASCTQFYADSHFVLHEDEISGIAYWERQQCEERPFTGFDASGLILRAAQICNIPYFCSNSTTVVNSLEPLTYHDLEEGDIIWAPGYLGVVGSLDNNEIIEAQGYARGYGKVHAIALNKRFENVATWQDFLYCCDYAIPFKSLDVHGVVVSYVPYFKIFKLPHPA